MATAEQPPTGVVERPGQGRYERDLRAATQAEQPHRYGGPPISREHILRLLVHHGVWQDVGTVRSSRLADALLLLIKESR